MQTGCNLALIWQPSAEGLQALCTWLPINDDVGLHLDMPPDMHLDMPNVCKDKTGKRLCCRCVAAVLIGFATA